MIYTMQVTQKLKKLIKSLHQKSFRDESGFFVVEGEKLVYELSKSDFVAELLVVRDSPSPEVIDLANYFSEKGIPIYNAQKHLFNQLTNTKTPQSILAVVSSKRNEPDYTKPFVALDGISDPGNVGTIIRTCSWFGFDQIILGNDCADCFNPKTVRSTMGAIFFSSVHYAPELHTYLIDNYKGFDIIGATIHSEDLLEKTKARKKFGLVFGNESSGISTEVQELITKQYKIEGLGSAESLNVAVAAGISMYHFKKFLQ